MNSFEQVYRYIINDHALFSENQGCNISEEEKEKLDILGKASKKKSQTWDIVPTGGEGGLVFQIQNAPVKQGDNAPNASKCYKPMKGM